MRRTVEDRKEGEEDWYDVVGVGGEVCVDKGEVDGGEEHQVYVVILIRTFNRREATLRRAPPRPREGSAILHEKESRAYLAALVAARGGVG